MCLTHDVGLPAVGDGLEVVGGDLAAEGALRRPVHPAQVHALGPAPNNLQHFVDNRWRIRKTLCENPSSDQESYNTLC